MGKLRQKAQKAKGQEGPAKNSNKMDVDQTIEEKLLGDSQGFLKFKNVKDVLQAKGEKQLTKKKKRELRRKILLQNNSEDVALVKQELNEEQPSGLSGSDWLNALEKEDVNCATVRGKNTGGLKVKHKPMKKAHQRGREYVQNIMKISRQLSKKKLDKATPETITERVKKLVSKMQK